jgi:hypothetical protein
MINNNNIIKIKQPQMLLKVHVVVMDFLSQKSFIYSNPPSSHGENI